MQVLECGMLTSGARHRLPHLALQPVIRSTRALSLSLRHIRNCWHISRCRQGLGRQRERRGWPPLKAVGQLEQDVVWGGCSVGSGSRVLEAGFLPTLSRCALRSAHATCICGPRPARLCLLSQFPPQPHAVPSPPHTNKMARIQFVCALVALLAIGGKLRLSLHTTACLSPYMP